MGTSRVNRENNPENCIKKNWKKVRLLLHETTEMWLFLNDGTHVLFH